MDPHLDGLYIPTEISLDTLVVIIAVVHACTTWEEVKIVFVMYGHKNALTIDYMYCNHR